MGGSVDAFGEHSYLFPGVFKYKDETGQAKSTGVTSSAKLFNLLSEPNRDLWKRLHSMEIIIARVGRGQSP